MTILIIFCHFVQLNVENRQKYVFFSPLCYLFINHLVDSACKIRIPSYIFKILHKIRPQTFTRKAKICDLNPIFIFY